MQGAVTAHARCGTKRKVPDCTKKPFVPTGMAKPIPGLPGKFHATRMVDGKNLYAFSCPSTCPCRSREKKMHGHAAFDSEEDARKAYREQLVPIRKIKHLK